MGLISLRLKSAKNMNSKGKIGIFDSGFGGLSIMKEIVKVLPSYDYVYFGDTARAPYGNRSQEVIFEFTKEGIDFLFSQGADLVVLACNTASSEALRIIQQEYLPKKYPDKKVLGVIIPAAEETVEKTKNKKVAVLATPSTVASSAFTCEIKKLDKQIKVCEIAAPLLVPLVEAGEDKSESAHLLVKGYVSKALKDGADTLVLGCTHYGILESLIKKYSKGVQIISEGKIVAKKLKQYLIRHKEIEKKLSKNKNKSFFTSDQSQKFDTFGSRFFGQKISSKTIHL
jgi:glutamate racemase